MGESDETIQQRRRAEETAVATQTQMSREQAIKLIRRSVKFTVKDYDIFRTCGSHFLGNVAIEPLEIIYTGSLNQALACDELRKYCDEESIPYEEVRGSSAVVAKLDSCAQTLTQIVDRLKQQNGI